MKISFNYILAILAFFIWQEARCETLLSAAELEHVMRGNTVRFHNLATGWRALAYFHPDGTAVVGDEHTTFPGTWRIEVDGTHCVTLKGGQERCGRVQRNADGTHSPIAATGNPRMTWLEVMQGKPPGAFAAIPSELVSFQSTTFPGHLFKPFMPSPEEGKPTRIGGILTLPPGTSRSPAVVLMHGCGGVSPAQRVWAATLSRLGIATLIVDSFQARSIREICTGKSSINVASVIVDAYRALDFLAANPRVDASRIAILGASFGGRTALWTSSIRFRERYSPRTADFAAHLAFYPSACWITLTDEASVSGAPIRVFHGTADEWTPIGPCKTYIGRLRQAGKDAALLEYPGAPHGFDAPGAPPLRTWPEALSAANCSVTEQDGKIIDPASGNEFDLTAKCISRGVSTGRDPMAHQKAVEDVQSFLQKLFGLNAAPALPK